MNSPIETTDTPIDIPLTDEDIARLQEQFKLSKYNSRVVRNKNVYVTPFIKRYGKNKY